MSVLISQNSPEIYKLTHEDPRVLRKRVKNDVSKSSLRDLSKLRNLFVPMTL